MFTSFSTALSALGAHSTAVDVVGNNLANLNTPGFKASSVAFYDLVTQSLGAGLGETQVGFGVARPITLRQFSQGGIQASSGPLDAAIQGDGFLVVRNQANQIVYTRGGSLQVDKAGNLLTATGEKIQGWTEVNGVLDTNSAVGDIVVPVGSLKAPQPSTEFSFDMNLNAAAPAGTKFSTSIEVYDSLGSSHIVSVNFTKSAANTWDYTVSIPDSDVVTPPAPNVSGQLIFDDGGRLDLTATTPPDPLTIPAGELTTGAAALELNWLLANGTVPRLTQFAEPSAVSANAQDGSPAAQLIRVGLANGGQVLAQYSNGQQIVVGQLAMASVRNPESLVSIGNNNYQLSARSALPAVGLPGTGGRGTIIGGAIENSTVDIAREFTNLIVLQRGYQANSRVVTTVDELSQETINLKR
ncbi:MAG: flagellar hook protein FlgE [Bryobacteraceae bacterium]|nr:flagellar hook protein FlgE [Bryobacterales bacterium]MEB2361095.1 flagellar hook protein FlgE [Bryobacterales bacterium]NUM99830.1 flagellar hook protein FlgE [Bryobacteraceae bacterium]